MEKLDRLNLNGNVNINFNKWIQSTSIVQRIHSNNPYQDDSFSGVDHTLINLPPTFDVRKGYLPDGSPVFLSTGNNPHGALQWQPANEFNNASAHSDVA